MSGSVLVIDQGTTSTRAIVFGPDALPTATAQEEFPQLFPQSGWVEHDPKDLWRTSLSTARIALQRAAAAGTTIAALGITNQRETILIWDRKTGEPIHNAIVWQDRRTASICATLKAEGCEPLVQQRSGLLLDPYFSATKIAWMLDHVDGAREKAERGDLAFGTVDTFLLWRLTNGAVHATDATNASRTALFDIHKGRWDADLLKLFRVPRPLLPEVKDCAAEFGIAAPEHLGLSLPIRGIAGDQQAALIGQACFAPGMVKSTFGTGCFVLLNTGPKPIASTHRLLSTIAYQLKGHRHYALEGSIFSAGATVQWLRDGLGIVRSSAETGQLAEKSDQEQAVYIVPAFVGLGAPTWDADARGTITGLTRATTRFEIARAALESVAYQTRDLIDAMQKDVQQSGVSLDKSVIRADGGMSASDWTMQSVADMIDAPVDRPIVRETTALGAGYLAGLQSGLYPSPEEFAATWHLETRFEPAMAPARRDAKLKGWHEAVARTVLKP
ncbi:glycerol kinase GlpK [Lichenihabitans psoromatis]|uniref:glycerol kinase GlpK n=1 Tax=Lichenihabitans psoromatis TaxID=2528642 RepID=UPI001038481E|nr:glycerol kinase GlpK [Lichenihabitans psoromatis]